MSRACRSHTNRPSVAPAACCGRRNSCPPKESAGRWNRQTASERHVPALLRSARNCGRQAVFGLPQQVGLGPLSFDRACRTRRPVADRRPRSPARRPTGKANVNVVVEVNGSRRARRDAVSLQAGLGEDEHLRLDRHVERLQQRGSDSRVCRRTPIAVHPLQGALAAWKRSCPACCDCIRSAAAHFHRPPSMWAPG